MSLRPRLLIAIGVVVLAAALAAYALRPRDAPQGGPPAFQVIVIKPGNFLADQIAEATQAGGRVPPESIDFQAEAFALAMADVARSVSGGAFLDLVRSAVDPAVLEAAVVLRSRDGEAITADGGDALANSNAAVLVIPRDILAMFDDRQTAFLIIRRRIVGLQ